VIYSVPLFMRGRDRMSDSNGFFAVKLYCESFVLSDLLSILLSEQGVFYRKYRLQRQFINSLSPVFSCK